MITISLCMIVKNEESVLSRCLDTVADIMDEIIIVDTGSTDKTKEIAARYTDKIYDYTWINDFADARNYSFSKATMDYIYAPDADELLDEVNRERFRVLKACLLPEIEIVQMKYVTELSNDAVMNAKSEYRPKLFKRQRSFTWIDPIHETVRLNPVVFDSDIEIIHRPIATHEKRDFSIFRQEIAKNGMLSDKLRMMYARELLKLGTEEDLCAARDYFLGIYNDNPISDAGKEAACVLARLARKKKDIAGLMKYALKDMLEKPCSEICYELGSFYEEINDYDEAIVWYMNAAYETESILDIHAGGDLAIAGIVSCYEKLILAENNESKLALYKDNLEYYRAELSAWSVPEE